MDTAVIGSASSGFSVITVEGWGRIDSGYPTFWGSPVASGFATAEEAFAWAADYKAKNQEAQ